MYRVMRFILQTGQSIAFGQEHLCFQQSGTNLIYVDKHTYRYSM